MRVCLAANTLHYLAEFWPYLNWALSLQEAGCEVVWLEGVEDEDQESPPDDVAAGVAELRRLLEPHGLAGSVALTRGDAATQQGAPLPGTLPLEAALDADLLINLAYMPDEVVRRFRRSAFVDLDPGMTQLWISRGELDIGRHDAYFSIGDTVETGTGRVPECGISWTYTPTPVALQAWEPAPAPASAAYTTISHWWDPGVVEIDGVWVESSKQAGFEPFLDLPARTNAPLELALGGLDDEEERATLERRGWRVRDAAEATPTPDGYRDYVRGSRGEFSAAKPPYVRLESGWLNDRTASYLAAGKPVVLQWTGSGPVPDGEGLLRFATLEEAARALDAVEADYDHHARRARELAEERFDGAKVVGRLLERAMS
jgi:hypothetical protein